MLDILNAIKIGDYFDGNTFLYDKYTPNAEDETSFVMNEILSLPVEKIVEAILMRNKNIELLQTDFPLMSSFDDATTKIVETLDTFNNCGLSFLKLGSLLRETEGTDGANVKYGESHAKVAEMLGLVTIQNESRKRIVFLTNVGYYFLVHRDDRDKVITRLLLRTKVLGNIISNGYRGEYIVSDDMQMFTNKTLNRRLSVVKALI